MNKRRLQEKKYVGFIVSGGEIKRFGCTLSIITLTGIKVFFSPDTKYIGMFRVGTRVAINAIPDDEGLVMVGIELA